jgi:hypothetical protein
MTTTDDVQLGTRIPRALLKRVDAHLERLKKEGTAGAKFSRSDAVRNLLTVALDSLEKRR